MLLSFYKFDVNDPFWLVIFHKPQQSSGKRNYLLAPSELSNTFVSYKSNEKHILRSQKQYNSTSVPFLDSVFVYLIKPSSAKTFAPGFSVKIFIANERNTCYLLNNTADYWENN